MSDTKLKTLDPAKLDRARGGGFFGNAWKAIKTAAGYAVPSPAGEMIGAAQAAPGVAAVAAQSSKRNQLIREMSAGPNYSNKTFSEYNNGKAAVRARNLINQ